MNRFALSLLASVAAFSVPGAAVAQDIADNSRAASAESYPPLFAAEMERAQGFVDDMLAAGIVVPVPADPGGGYTHEQHKRNYRAMFLAGQLHRLTGEERYAGFVRDMLLEYADLYPTLTDHPARSNQNAGRIFWQVLNDAVWLVHAVQAYEAIREELDAETRQRIDDDVFRRAAHFLSVESKATFNRIHNHATWATAGVGMTGYLIGDRDMVDRALLGSDKSGETGFLRQTELLFSPDGYYAEGPYYQRYALMPFMVFAGAINRNEPERKIFAHRGGILEKALKTTIQLTYDGYFFPFNDAIRDKSLNTDELYHGVAIGYAITGDPALLDVARMQGRTVITPEGLELSRALAAGKAEPFIFRSMLLGDGPEGDQGAVAVMRSGSDPGHMALVAKNSSQGMGHGHFDKLSWQMYDNGKEVVRDYGAARFLNVVAKAGGRYLPENETWAKQSIAHNALTVNGKSHFYGDRDLADRTAPTQLHFESGDGLQASAARIGTAYPRENVDMSRLIAMVDVPGLSHPVALDVLRASGDGDLRFDLPLHYSGHITRLGFEPESYSAARPVLGESDGYQHVWVDARGTPDAGQGFLTWILDGRFYTYRFVPRKGAEIILGESGANDPAFNLRRAPLAIQRMDGVDDATFVSIVEPHGLSDGAVELVVDSDSQVAALRHVEADDYDIVIIETLGGDETAVAISWDQRPDKQHSVVLGNGRRLDWTGFVSRIAMKPETGAARHSQSRLER
ncbi:MAG: alginate lyase family protein [Pacificimonas sp.]